MDEGVEERLDSVPVRSHLLPFHYARRKDLVDCRFDKASRDSQPIAAVYFAATFLGQKMKRMRTGKYTVDGAWCGRISYFVLLMA